MRFPVTFGLIFALSLTGCGQPDAAAPAATEESSMPLPDAMLGEATSSPEAMEDEAVDGPGVPLTPDNTVIQFVGTHADPNKPDPRTGRFEQFTGSAVLENAILTSVRVEIDTASLTTEIDKLTNHLKSPDFFDVNQHPNATFTSTSIEHADDGTATITGDLTLLDETKSISFPATVSTEGGGLKLNAQFTISRSAFGMNFGRDSVMDEVEMTVRVDG